MGVYGEYHRNETRTQTAADAAQQEASGEIWGKTPLNGITPTVQAYNQRGIKQARRIEFSTDVKPHTASPFEVRWYLGSKGVERREREGEEFACIKVDISTNLQV